ncbi:hypothetical protein [Schleiferia thermophila]|uniref:Uncharacterized protein n=1 Tax=Schleiferia thermophila TaxID=884107 RepID=A0A369A8S0_9FLAO|nr:hypothetical protein [Schleiferia thermophila]RCX05521.1 hypothetical protein DES35_101808 [Schleiferia thermophila]GCD78986.1 hypothetical protein JCM30197_02330 [Schleiferia thermophila]
MTTKQLNEQLIFRQMKKLKSTAVLFGLILVVTMTSCTTTRVATLTKGDNETIELFTTKLPDKKYSEISYIQTDGAVFHTPQQLLNGLKKKAIELKADAVINIKYDFQAWYPVVSGTAIKYVDK